MRTDMTEPDLTHWVKYCAEILPSLLTDACGVEPAWQVRFDDADTGRSTRHAVSRDRSPDGRRETQEKGFHMGLDDKISNKVEESGGEVKEHVGHATDDGQLEA